MRGATVIAGGLGAAIGLLAGLWLGGTTRGEPETELVAPSTPTGAGAPVAGAPVAEAALEAPTLAGAPAARAAKAAQRLEGALDAQGQVVRAPSALRELLAQALRVRYAAKFEGATLAEAEIEACLDLVPKQLDGMLAVFLGRIAERQRQREGTGVLSDPAEIVLQAASRGGYVATPSNFDPQAPPFDLSKPPKDWNGRGGVRGGVLPPGMALRVTEVALEVTPTEVGPSAAGARVRLQGLHPRAPLRIGRVQGRHASQWETDVLLEDLEHAQLALWVEAGSAQAIVRGRLVPIPGPEAVDRGVFKLRSIEGGGLVSPELVVLQVRAVHSGGNPCTVTLDGSDNGYVREHAAQSVWEEPTGEPASGRESRVHASGAGAIPPGQVLEVTRAEYRAWRTRSAGSSSQASATLVGSNVFSLTAKEGGSDEARGAWEGRVLIRPGQEDHVQVSASYHACVEVRLVGRLLDEREAAAAGAKSPDAR
jgi:hypothetical protein